MSKDKCWPALALFAQMQCSKTPYIEGTQQLKCLQIILTLIYKKLCAVFTFIFHLISFF